MLKRFKTGLVIACEHIVVGQSNKPTFVGVFTNDIIVESYPSQFWISFFAEIMDADSLPVTFNIEVRLDRSVVGTIKLEMGPEIDPKLPVSAIIPSGLLKIEKQSEIKLVARAEGYRDEILVKKMVRLA